MAGSNHQAGWGKMAQHRLWGRHGFYRRGRLRKSAHVRESLVGWGCLRAWEFLLRGGAAIFAADSQNGDIITLSKRISVHLTFKDSSD
jgi:hypothetical protein